MAKNWRNGWRLAGSCKAIELGPVLQKQKSEGRIKSRGDSMYIDSHTHFAHRRFDKIRDTLLPKLHSEGLEMAVEAAISVRSNFDMQKSLEPYPWIYYAVGLHPNFVVADEEEDEAQMESICLALNHEKVVAIGETGLDFHRLTWETPEEKEQSLRLIERQKQWFRKLIELAREKQLPLIIHSRDAHEDTLEILKEYDWQENSGVIHCFHAVEALSVAREYMDLGFYLGIGGMVSYDTESAVATRLALKELPMEKLLLETDCPFLLPDGCEDTPNHSGNIPVIAEIVARQKGLPVEEVYRITMSNTRRLFC